MTTILLLIGFVLAAVHFAEAQQPTKIPRIGYVSGTGDAMNQGPYVEALRRGLRDLGYTEGRNIAIEYRGAEGKSERYPSLVNDLVQMKVDVLIVPTLPATLIAKEATKTIPIVMVSNRDPVATGIVDSLARPGGNITGLHSNYRGNAMSRQLKLTLFVLAFNIIAFAALAKISIDGISWQCYARFGIFGKVRSFDSFSKQVSRLKQVGVRDKPVVREGEESGKRNCCSQDVLFG